MRLIGSREQQAIDRLWQSRSGLPLLVLMESAAAAVSRVCLDLVPAQSRRSTTILVLCGKGLNGGDAFACARHLAAAGCRVLCREVFPGEKQPAEAASNRKALVAMGVVPEPLKDIDFEGLGQDDLIIDGIFGTGYRADRPMPDIIQQASEMSGKARDHGARIVAIDVPSGLDADNGALAPHAFSADVTVTFILPKIGLWAAPGRFAAGRVLTDTIHVGDDLVDTAMNQLGQDTHMVSLITADSVAGLAPARPADAHKGMFGRVLFLGGSQGMPGAALLAADAAARSGAGLITAAVPTGVAPLLLAARPEVMIHSLDINQHPDRLESILDDLLKSQPAVVIGPGGGMADWLSPALDRVIGQADRLLIDADGLNRIASDENHFFEKLRSRQKNSLAPAILTPHPGEFSRLLPGSDLKDRQAGARKLARETCCVVVLKGASTVVARPDGRTWINPTGHDGLARGGSGDVLSGLITGLLAQGFSPESAATAGVYLHGRAAELASLHTGRRAMLPTDVIEALPKAYHETGWET